MEVRLSVRNIDLREAQEKVDDNLRQVREAGRKAILAYAGLWGMAYDEAMTVVNKGKAVFDKAEDRGEKLEAAANRRTEKVRTQAEEQLKAVEARIEKVRSRFSKRAEKVEEAIEEDLENQVERVLERLGIPSRERISKLSAEIEALSQKIDAQLAAKQEVVVPIENAAPMLPIANYSEMTAKEIVPQLEKLTKDELAVVKRYEENTQARVTVLREIDRLLEPVFA